jgi:insulysin
MDSPQSHAIYYINYIVQEKLWHNDDKINELENVTVESLQNYIPSLLSSMFYEVLIYGNVYEEAAVKWSDIIRTGFECKPLHPFHRLISARSHIIPHGTIIFTYPKGHYALQLPVHNVHNLNSAIEYVLQVGSSDEDNKRTVLSLIGQIASEPCFDQLRTKEQLGYIVFSGIRKGIGMLAFRVIVQSEKHPIYIESRVDNFISRLREIIVDLSDEEFEKHKAALVSKLTEKSKNMKQEAKRYWAHIDSKYYDFGQMIRDASVVPKIKKSEVLELFDRYLSVSAPSRRKLTSQILSQKVKFTDDDLLEAFTKKNAVISIEDIPQFKACLELSRAALPRETTQLFKL